jgi:hypothetical protein
LDKWCSDKLGLPLVETESARGDLIEVIETRNVFVHNGGVVGAKYCRNVTNSPFLLGQKRMIDLDYLIHAFEVLLGCGHSLDERLGPNILLVMLTAPRHNNSLDATGGRMFRNFIDPAMLD